MDWLPASALVSEVTSEEDVSAASEDLRSILERQELGVRTVKRDYQEIKLRAETLPKIIPDLQRLRVTWRYINSGYQFRFSPSEILCWWPRTGSCMWLRQKSANLDIVKEIKDKLKDAPPLPDHVVPACLACLVCGGQNVSNSCQSCARVQVDLCSSCFLLAHWCV